MCYFAIEDHECACAGHGLYNFRYYYYYYYYYYFIFKSLLLFWNMMWLLS
ncbi:hypothetical protein CsSME_00028487 [Camellia sinensis var. sinensis]